jgi:hypothetical protein
MVKSSRFHLFTCVKLRPFSCFQIESENRTNDNVFSHGNHIKRFYNSNFNRFNMFIEVLVTRFVNLKLDSN